MERDYPKYSGRNKNITGTRVLRIQRWVAQRSGTRLTPRTEMANIVKRHEAGRSAHEFGRGGVFAHTRSTDGQYARSKESDGLKKVVHCKIGVFRGRRASTRIVLTVHCDEVIRNASS